MVGLFAYRSGVNLDPALFNVLAVSISSASNELRQGTVGIDCFLRGRLPGNDMLSFEPLFRRGLQLSFGLRCRFLLARYIRK